MNAIIISALLGVIMMFSGIITNNNRTIRTIAAFGLLILLASNILETNGTRFFDIDTYGMLSFGRFGLFFNTILIASTLVFMMLSGSAMDNVGKRVAEYCALIFFILTGACILSSFSSLLMMFLGIEILSIPLYILTGAEKRNLKSNEAALKYFLMGSFSTGLMLMGIALLFGATGSFAIEKVANGMTDPKYISFLSIGGLLFLMVSMAFKVSAAPFHFWTPDVYDGAPTVFTSFMATVAKAAGFIAFIKLFDIKAPETAAAVNWKMLFSILIVATLLIGNVTAVYQQSVKRMLAYSSIAQAGFMLIALFSMNGTAHEGFVLYAASYSLATIGIFAILLKMRDITFDGFNGLARTQPVLAATNTIFLLSLAGIPLTAGFFAKYYMLASVVETGSYLWLVVVAVVFAAISVYYYFRVIQAMYFKAGNAETVVVTGGFKAGLILVSAIIVVIGVLPQVILNWLYF